VIANDIAMNAYLDPYFEHIHLVPKRVNVAALDPAPPDPEASRMRVVHAPTHLEGKGTRFVRAAIDSLVAEGAPIDYVEVHGMSHERALEICRGADLVVDQLCSGSYGVLAAEAMGLAKPVVCYLLPEIEAASPEDLPIINANPETVKDVLSGWLERPRERHQRGLASRRFAEREHDHRTAASKLLDVYRALP